MSEYIIKVGKHDYYVKDYRFSALNGDIGLMLTERIEEAYKWDDLTEGKLRIPCVFYWRGSNT
nr:hypothetical protein P5629_08490 [Bacillus subtilis]